MKTRALVICGDAWHPAEIIRLGLLPLENHGFDFEFFEDGAKLSARMLRTFSVVVLAKANMISATDQRAWLTHGSETAFQNYWQRGKGLLIIHGGTSRYGNLPVMRRVTGGAFLSHPPECAVTLEPNPSHELSHGVEIFTVREEHYQMAFEGSATDIFLQSRSDHGVQPAGWTRIEGKGRVCVLTPGHNVEVWLHPSFQNLLLNALRWTAKIN